MLNSCPEHFTSIVSISPMSMPTMSMTTMAMVISTPMVRFMVVTNLLWYLFRNLEQYQDKIRFLRSKYENHIIPFSEFGTELFYNVFLQHLCKLLSEPFLALLWELYGNFVLEHLCNVLFGSFLEHRNSVPLALGSNVFWESRKKCHS